MLDLLKKSASAPAKTENNAPVAAAGERVYLPAVDVLETADAFVLLADLPGVEENAVEISIEQNRLTLRARRSSEKPATGEPGYQEYRPGNYEREFTLGDRIDRDQVKATLKNGVLNLVLPKTREQKPRRITVAAG